MKKLLLPFILAISLFLFSACNVLPQAQPTPVIYEANEDETAGKVITDGEIVPANDSQMIAQTSGQIEEVLQTEGDLVTAGQVILRLKAPQQLQAELKSAQADQLKAQQAIDQLTLNGNLQKQQAYQRVLNAQKAVDIAQAAWDSFDQDKYDRDLEKAKEDVISAKEDLDDAKEKLKDYLDLEKDNPQRKKRQKDVDNAQVALNKLKRKQNELEQTYAQLKLNLELTNAEIITAQKEYEKFNQENVPSDQMMLLQEMLGAANARISAIQSSLDDLQISAPIDGTLVKLNVKAGEWIYPGQPIATVADLSTWYVNTTDLNELKIVKIKINDPVTLEFDAFPGKVLRGKVIEISDLPTMKFNDVIYPVKIEIQDNDLPLRWKMSVIVTFQN